MKPRYIFSTLLLMCISQFPLAELNFSSAPNHLKFLGGEQIPHDTPDPINIVTKDVKFVETKSPFLFVGGLGETWRINHTGKSIEVNTGVSTVESVTGGVLNDDFYALTKYRFYWHLNSTTKGHYAATTINGKVNTPLEIRSFWYNLKYGSFENALNYRDGLAIFSIRIFVGFTPNPLYFSFEHSMKKIKKPGDSVFIISSFASKWFANFPPNTTYYAYPGSYTDESTGKLYYSSTTIILEQVPSNFISHDQFKDSFGHLEDRSGQPLINAVPQYPQGSRTVVKSKGLVLKLKI